MIKYISTDFNYTEYTQSSYQRILSINFSQLGQVNYAVWERVHGGRSTDTWNAASCPSSPLPASTGYLHGYHTRWIPPPTPDHLGRGYS